MKLLTERFSGFSISKIAASLYKKTIFPYDRYCHIHTRRNREAGTRTQIFAIFNLLEIEK